MKMHRLLVVLSILCLSSPLLGAPPQQEGKSSRREVSVIAAIEAAGGRVNKISAADDSREISFNLSRSPVGDDQLKGISAVQEVIWCNLAGTGITDGGVKYLAGMPLQKLHLERTAIGDEGLRHLKSCQDLEYLNVYGTKISDKGLEHLRGLKKLKKLYVWQTGVTEAGIVKLKQSLPGLAIIGEVKLSAKVVEAPAVGDSAKEDQNENSDAPDEKENDESGDENSSPDENNQDATGGEDGADKD